MLKTASAIQAKEAEVKKRVDANWKIRNRSVAFPDDVNDQYLRETEKARSDRSVALMQRVVNKIDA